jgi:hypothetical protein
VIVRFHGEAGDDLVCQGGRAAASILTGSGDDEVHLDDTIMGGDGRDYVYEGTGSDEADTGRAWGTRGCRSGFAWQAPARAAACPAPATRPTTACTHLLAVGRVRSRIGCLRGQRREDSRFNLVEWA